LSPFLHYLSTLAISLDEHMAEEGSHFLLFDVDHVVTAFPRIAFGPEEGKSDRRTLRRNDRNIDEVDSESGCRGRSIFDSTPLVARPTKTKRSRSLDPQTSMMMPFQSVNQIWLEAAYAVPTPSLPP
jgi:hypothetical protein